MGRWTGEREEKERLLWRHSSYKWRRGHDVKFMMIYKSNTAWEFANDPVIMPEQYEAIFTVLTISWSELEQITYENWKLRHTARLLRGADMAPTECFHTRHTTRTRFRQGADMAPITKCFHARHEMVPDTVTASVDMAPTKCFHTWLTTRTRPRQSADMTLSTECFHTWHEMGTDTVMIRRGHDTEYWMFTYKARGGNIFHRHTKTALWFSSILKECNVRCIQCYFIRTQFWVFKQCQSLPVLFTRRLKNSL